MNGLPVSLETREKKRTQMIETAPTKCQRALGFASPTRRRGTVGAARPEDDMLVDGQTPGDGRAAGRAATRIAHGPPGTIWLQPTLQKPSNHSSEHSIPLGNVEGQPRRCGQPWP